MNSARQRRSYTKTLPIANIILKERYRKDLGDIYIGISSEHQRSWPAASNCGATQQRAYCRQKETGGL
jgi:hypothetical protein